MIYIGTFDEKLAERTAGRRVVAITEPALERLYGDRLPAERIVVPGGEEHKTLATAEAVWRRLREMEADRSVFLVGFGGGIVTDLTGFVASTYMRGVEFGFVATTLLAQVDAAIGGKNGVNLDGYKNMVGTFTLPQFVIADPAVLDTLPERELRAGMGEVIKYGLIEDPEILVLTDRAQVIGRCMEIKQRIVEADFREGGVRKLLNFGHTYGHAVEKAVPGRYLHGEAVAIGMVEAAKMSVRRGMLSEGDLAYITEKIEAAGLPTVCEGASFEELTALIRSDKKRKGNTVEMILLEGIGRPVICPIEL